MKLALLVFSCLAASAMAQSGLNILDVARRHGLYSFLFALEETNNVEVLSRAENVTVFIPTNDAFQKVTPQERNKWRSDPSYYQNLLRYHVVVEGRFMKSDFMDRDEQLFNTSSSLWPTARFLNYTGYSNDMQTYQDAVITVYDIEASNGVIHLLDQVVSAPQNQTILQILESRADLSNITDVIKRSPVITGLLDGSNPKPVTFLAPDNDAIKKLSPKDWNTLNNTAAGVEILQYQILSAGTWFSRGLKDELIVTTLNKNGNRTVSVTAAGVFFDKAGVVAKDLAATNGVSHIVDTLVFPKPYSELF